MAKRKKTNQKPGRVGKIALGIFAALLVAVVVTLGVGCLNASLLRIRRAEIALTDLPSGFDGVTLLYASDIDLCGINTPARAGALFQQLQSLRPDILILGGDYNSTSLLDRLNNPDESTDDEAKKLAARSGFFYYISAFEAPLGKFAIATEEDPQWQNLKALMSQNGVRPLFNASADISTKDGTLWLTGLCGSVSNLNDIGRIFSRNECVIAIVDTPEALPMLLTSEADDGGQWADLILCGHTHGGQIRLLGRTVLSLSQADQRFRTGWNTQSGIPILTTEGIGCEGLNIRLGTEPEVWLITLRRT